MKAKLLAQHAGLAVAAAVLEIRELERHQSQPIEMRRELGNAPVVRPQHAGRRLTPQNLLGIGEEAGRRHDHRHAVRDRRVVEHTHILIGDDAPCSNESHRHAP